MLLALGVVLLGLGALLTARTVDVGATAAALARADVDLLIAAGLLFALAQSLSGLMWGRCQHAGGVRGIGWGHVLSLHWLSRAACELTPASLGEAARVALVRRHPGGARAGTWRVVGALAAYKALDGVVTGAVVFAILVAAPLPPAISGLRTTAAVAVGAAVLVLLLVHRLHGDRLLARLPAGARRALAGLGTGLGGLRRPAEMRLAVVLGVAAVAARVAAFAVLLAAFGVPAEAALLVFAVTQLAGLLPLAPGGVGAREALLVPALAAAHGVPAASALAFSLTTQVLALVVTLAAALLALAHQRFAGVVELEPVPRPAPSRP
ncbi:MAG TPA: lysylphosphatidylglycerol synthase domain-containing protein [Miltoncostaeaceae bacterium]|nr:lysylphosphatidylglycerol synthase domain-containing protein [Miltoncostaeaceae bacterium]